MSTEIEKLNDELSVKKSSKRRFHNFIPKGQDNIVAAYNYVNDSLDDIQDHYGDMVSNLFEKFVIIGKVSLIGGLSYLSFAQNNTEFISANPKEFLGECCMVGITAAVPTMLCLYTHKSSDDPFNYNKLINSILISFLVFFIFHLLMEFSGANNIDTAAINQQKAVNLGEVGNFLSNSAVLGAFTCLSILFAICCKNNGTFQRNPYTSKKYQKTSPGIFWRTLFEATVFAGVNFAAYYKILFDRGTLANNAIKSNDKIAKSDLLSTDQIVKKSSIIAAMYFSGYFILQRGGFFDNMFNDNRDKECQKWFGSTPERKREIFNNWLADQDPADKVDYMSKWFEDPEEKNKIVALYNEMNKDKNSSITVTN